MFVSNRYLSGDKFSEPEAMFGSSAERMGIELVPMTNAELMVRIGDEDALGKIIGDADFILFWDKDIGCAKNLELCGYRVFNTSECIRICDDKSLTHLALMGSDVPSLDTIVCPMSFFDYPEMDFLDHAIGQLGFPMVVKDCFGSFGQQVRLVNDKDQLRKELSGPYKPRILQRFMECGGRDVRIEVVGGNVVAAMERHAPEGDFRSNATIGGSIKGYIPSEEESELAIRACEAIGADFAGVDVIGDRVCEINSNAHLKNLLDCTGIDVSEMILEHIRSTLG